MPGWRKYPSSICPNHNNELPKILGFKERSNMEIKAHIKMELDVIDTNIKRVLDGLSQDEVAWRPACGCNSIGLILFHIIRSEDSLLHAGFTEEQEVWKTGEWYKRLNIDKAERGSQYTIEQVNAFVVPELGALLSYYSAVRNHTLEILEALNGSDLDRKIIMPHWGEIPVSKLFFIIVMHTCEHTGEISYLRGLQRGMDN